MNRFETVMRVPPILMAPRGPSSPTLISCSLCKKRRRAFRQKKKNSTGTKPSFVCLHFNFGSQNHLVNYWSQLVTFTAVAVHMDQPEAGERVLKTTGHTTRTLDFLYAHISFVLERVVTHLYDTRPLTQVSQHTKKTPTLPTQTSTCKHYPSPLHH